MIARYSLPEMSRIWQQQNKFQKMMEVEVAACEAHAKRGKIPKKALANIQKKAKFDLASIEALDKKTNHDVAAFVENLQDNIGPGGEYVHMGLTSNDVTDTALALQMKDAADIIIDDLIAFKDVLAKKAKLYRNTAMIGRSHGVHAEPITFGFKMAIFFEETKRNIERMEQARENISVGKISGAVGTFSNLEPQVEDYVCKKLKLRPAPISNQVLQRDRHAQYLAAIAITGATLEKLATEIRGLQRTEILEAEEYFSKNQKGSSAMPHKRNPITCEKICGLARLLRSNAHAAMENISLWHERDISHSSVERVILPDSTILIDYMLRTMTQLIEHLVIYPENMQKNLKKTGGLIFSQRVMIELIKAGLTREQAYRLVQKHAMNTWKEGKDFKEALLNDKEVCKLLKPYMINKCFELDYYLRNINVVLKRIGIISK
ncbi:MAG: adenylosuccinate lyase [Candidatus Orphnella occulta]|nr:adenylosuccinate lyase [Candidatus Orphnella occulta]